jgi:hypothetical protein
MLLKLGTNIYHFFLGVFYVYNVLNRTTVNFIEIGFAPWIYFTISLNPLELCISFRKTGNPFVTSIILWIRKGQIIFKDKIVFGKKQMPF